MRAGLSSQGRAIGTHLGFEAKMRIACNVPAWKRAWGKEGVWYENRQQDGALWLSAAENGEKTNKKIN